MDLRDKGIQTQLRNIEAATGRSLDDLDTLVAGLGETSHGARRARLESELGLSFAHADTLLFALEARRAGPLEGDPLDAIYTGAKARLRPIHEAIVRRIEAWGPVEHAPKKGYVSVRRKKQLCMIGPGTRGRLAVGINAPDRPAGPRLRALPPGKLCPREVWLEAESEVDDELLGWLRAAWERAG